MVVDFLGGDKKKTSAGLIHHALQDTERSRGEVRVRELRAGEADLSKNEQCILGRGTSMKAANNGLRFRVGFHHFD